VLYLMKSASSVYFDVAMGSILRKRLFVCNIRERQR
jgi:hypothetical protein